MVVLGKFPERAQQCFYEIGVGVDFRNAGRRLKRPQLSRNRDLEKAQLSVPPTMSGQGKWGRLLNMAN